MPSTAAAWFRLVATAEALSWAGLLVGMVFKHLLRGTALQTDVGVEVFGAIHGGVFMAYLLVVALAFRRLRWSLPTTALAVVASVPPFATVVFERWATRTGRLPSSNRPRESVPA